ncbi:3-deoxy-D-manno-octulosonic-acid transferase [Bryocella elongata]|uniref:3-deoxy-D-manno-octulosonic acid transferase n=2 Tax=Bryocella elongata TaxID=863522 RepID=A0A1H6AK31_9BACT|nr:3-deoxy-D-manno-octulosonic-acid transferase [Bryocella elongata]
MPAYSLLLLLALTLSAPWWLTRMLTTQRYREGLAQRLGRVPATLREYARGHRIVWLHAVSVGEVLAATRLVAELDAALREQKNDSFRIVISTTTRTGQELARQRFGAERVFYYPLDLAFAVRAYLNALMPDALILMESELWPRMLAECHRRSIPVSVVNARVSDRSFARAQRFRAIWSRLLAKVTLFLAQSEEDARRLVNLGARADGVRTSGNLKYDVRAPKQSKVADLIRIVANGRPIVVAGSTVASTEARVAPEEAQVVESWMRGALPSDALLVLAPRHPERFEEAWQIAYDFPSLRATDLLAGKSAEDTVQRNQTDGHSLDAPDIVLLDTIGDLAAVYELADVAYVGGSMFPRGGHNPLEPAQFGVPVVMGQSFENFRDIVGKMREVDAIRIVRDELELEEVFRYLIEHRDEARSIGARGRSVFEQQQGATARTVDALLALLSGASR